MFGPETMERERREREREGKDLGEGDATLAQDEGKQVCIR